MWSKIEKVENVDNSKSDVYVNITRFWLAENECIFHFTRVQSCNTGENYK